MFKALLSLSVALFLTWSASLFATQPQPIASIPPERLTPKENGHKIDAQQRLSIVSGGRVRSEPDSASRIVETLTLGAVMAQTGRTEEPVSIGEAKHYWYQVTLDSGQEGWIFGALTIPYHPSQRLELYRQLVAERMQSELSFADQMEVTRLIATLLEEMQETHETSQALLAELQFAYLRSIQKTLRFYNQADPEQRENDPYAAWLDYLTENASEVVFYDEVSDRQLVAPQAFWDLYTRYPRLNRLSEIMAWVGAVSPRGGECEGDLNCFLNYQLTEGFARYLAVYPNGVKQKTALQYLAKMLEPQVAWMVSDETELAQQFKQLNTLLTLVQHPIAETVRTNVAGLAERLL